MKIIFTFCKGFSIYFKNINDVIFDIEKQKDIIENQEKSKQPNIHVLSETYDYLQKLVDVHGRIFPSGVSLVLSLLAFFISLIALVLSVFK